MLLKRLQVEEGFLDGLVVEFRPGLNVLIGARGTGKTSVIELIRFALGVEPFTAEAAELSSRHASAVLGPGKVTLTIDIGDNTVTVSRTIADRTPRLSGDVPPLVTVLSQTEIEAIAVDPAGRLRLLDDIAGESPSASEEMRLIAQIRSWTTELAALREVASGLDEEVSELPSLREELKGAIGREAELAGSLEEYVSQREELASLSAELSVLAARKSRLDDIADRLRESQPSLGAARRAIPSVAVAEDEPADSVVNDVRSFLAEAEERLAGAEAAVARALDVVSETVSAIESETGSRSDQARELRKVIDAATAGAGDASEAVTRLRSAVATKEALVARSEELVGQMERLVAERDELLDLLDEIREERFESRSKVAASLTAALQPRVQVLAERYGSRSMYENAIMAALRGSRLHYNQLAPAIADSLSPRELVKSAEASDPRLLVEVVGLDDQRANRVLTAISSSPDAMLDLLAAPVDDDIRLELLDGPEYKRSDQLSTGQRCTVVLPILLEQQDRILIMDQPEDHLDNAFITETVVKALRNRGSSQQSLIATHNANIPVLGDASYVIVMRSDGVNGFSDPAGPLEDPDIVEAITDLMEGGREAFHQRAIFYGEIT